VQRIGKYEIKGQLGVGGFGQVFRALDPTMGRMVAIKLLTAAGDPDIQKRFRNEAAAAGKLRHKNIVTVYDFGEQDGAPYIVMELMEGEDLHRVITKKRSLTLLRKIRIMMETAEGLHHAHANGIVHRDVKPANIMVLNDGGVKIMDFGIALVTQDTANRLTPQGSMLGTFRYMAPEQFFGMPSDEISDIFSYGIIFYELISGKHPFHSTEPAAVMRNITICEPEPLRRVAPDCPEALESICARLLAKERDQRYQNLDDVHYDLAAILLELEGERAKEILAEARRLIASDDLNGAQVLVRKVLDVNPANREARELRESLQQLIQRKSVRPKIDSLVKTGKEELAAGRHSEAIQSFESALKLDRSNQEIWEQIEQAKALMERSKALAKLRTEARSALDRKDFEAARKSALEMMRLDSGNPEVSQLLKEIQDASDRVEREHRLDDAIEKAQNLAAMLAYDEALTVLDALGPDASDPTVQTLIESLRAKQEEAAKRQRLKSGLATAADMLSNRQFEEAVAELEKLRAEFPSDEEVARFFQYGQRELEAERRAKAVDEAVRKIEGQIAAKDFAAALLLLDESLKRFSDDGVLLRLKTRTQLEKTKWERQQAIDAALKRCRDLEGQKRFADAIQAIEAALSRYGAEPSLEDLQTRLRQALEQQKRDETVRQAVTEANRQFKQGLPENAMAPIQEALAKYADDAELIALKSRVEQECERAIRDLRREAAGQAQTHDFDRAIATLERALGRFPREQALLEELEEVKTTRTVWQREEAIAAALGDATRLAGEKRFEQALEVLAKARTHNSARIKDATARIQAEWDAHQRRTAVAKTVSDARALLDRQQPRDAVSLLTDACARYRGERELDDLLTRAQQELQQQERSEIVARVTREAQAQAASQNFDAALQTVNAGLQQVPEEESLLQLQESIQTQQAAWKHQEAMREVERQASLLARQGKLEEARQLVAKAISRFPDEGLLAELQKRLDLEWEQRKRNEAVRALVAKISARIESGQFDDALWLIADACSRYPGESAFDPLRQRAEAELQARRQREQAAQDANSALTAGRPEEGVRLLQDALQRFPGDVALSAMLATAEAQLRARKRVEGIQKTLADARALAARREFDRAQSVLDQGLASWPDEQALLDERQINADAKTAWEREQKLLALISESEGHLRENRIAEGLKTVESALREFPDTSALVTLQQKLRFRDTVDRISRLIAEHRPDEALRLLTPLQAEYPGDPELKILAERAEKEREAQRRAAAIDKVVADAKNRTSSRDFDGALAALDAALKQYPEEPILTTTRQETLAARSAWQLAEQRRQVRERDLAELNRLANTALRSTKPAEYDEILQSARRLSGQHPGEAEIQKVAQPLIEQLSALQSANQELAKQNLAAVLTACTTYLAQYPGHAAFTALKNEAEKRQRRLDVQALLRRCADETNIEERVQLLSQGLKQYPGEAAIQQEYQLVRKKLDLVNSIRAKADAHEKSGQWDAALEQWSNLAAIEKGFPGLEAHQERIRKKKEEARAAAIAQWVGQIEEQIKAGDLVVADRVLGQALSAFPDAPPLKEIGARLAEIARSKAQARDLLAQAQSACDQGRYQEGRRLLKEALDLDRADPAFRKLVVNALVRFARAALKNDWRTSDVLLQDAVALDTGFKPPDDLVRSINEHKQNEAVAESLSRAEQLRSTGEFRAALGEVEQGLAAYPSDTRLKKQRESLDNELRAWRAKLISELRRLREASQSVTNPVQIDALLEGARAIASRSTTDAEVRQEADVTIRELTERRRQLKNAALWAGLLSRRKQFAYIAAIAVVAVSGFFGIRSYLTPPALVSVAVSSSPAGAAVKAGDQSCLAPCELHLKSGSYTVDVHLDGYKPLSQPVTVGDARHSLSFSLRPLPLLVQVSTNFASGQVSLDGKPAGNLTNGQLALNDVPFGEHDLAITAGEGKARVRFRTATGQVPLVLGSVESENADAVAIGNLGKTANVHSVRANEPVNLDGKTSGAISPGGLELRDLAEGNRELRVGARSLVMNVRPEPSLTFIVTSERNVGSLVVGAGREDGVTVSVNGRPVGQTSRGTLRLPLDVADTPYIVRVEKKGFKVQPPEQSVRVRKGEESKVEFRMDPVAQPVQNSRLAIYGAIPGSRVMVDGVAVGEVGGNGSFSSEIKPGDHDIELTKDGYTPRRIRKSFAAGAEVGMAKSESELPVLPPDPRQVEEQEWERIRNSRNAADFDDFVRRHPGSNHVGEARSRSSQITQQTQQDSARQAEQTAWDAVDKNNKAALQNFLSRFGNGAHAAQALGAINAIEKLEADALAREQQKKKDSEHAQSNSAALDQQAIVRAIGAFESAYNRMDLPGLQALWNGMPKSTSDAYRDQFRFAKSVAFQLQPLEAPAVSGDTATVACTRSLSLTLKSGPRPPGVNEKVRVTLGKAGTGWVIRSITPM
jgi:serine/threonine-protein kinase